MNHIRNLRYSVSLLFSGCVLLFATTLFTGCVNNEYIVDDIRTDQDNSYTDQKKYPVFFSPRIETNFTKSNDIPFPAGKKAQIFAFVNDKYNTFLDAPVYDCKTAGTFAGTGIMYLPYGNYNFYGISLLTDSLPLEFISNEATGLKNGIDYIWGSITDQEINSPTNTFPITFYHKASQVCFTIVNKEETEGIKEIYDTSNIGVPPPTTDSKWSLSTGIISQITATPSDTASGSSLNISGLTLSTIFLPYNSSDSCIVNLNCITTNNTDLKAKVSVPIPSGGYVSGYSYNYDITYTGGDSIVMGDVLVAPWKEIIEPDVTVP